MSDNFFSDSAPSDDQPELMKDIILLDEDVKDEQPQQFPSSP
jgi:hypothetical protein